MTADLPQDSMPLLLSGIDMLYASDLQWSRFWNATEPSERTNVHPYSTRWSAEAHFFLVAADNAHDRLLAWSREVRDNDLSDICARLGIEHLKDFRHHQEHLEERMPGGKWESRGLTHDVEKITRFRHVSREEAVEEALAGTLAHNNLFNRRFLTFGDEVIDLVAAHDTILAVARDLRGWLRRRQR